MKPLGKTYAAAEASGGSDFQRLPAGGYVCKIIKVTDYPKGNRYSDKPYLEIVYDVAEGVYANYYDDDWGKSNEWAHMMRQYYTPAAFGVFKGFLKTVDASNGTTFEKDAEIGLDEQQLKGRLIGVLLQEEEYIGNDGSLKTRLKVVKTLKTERIRKGDFTVPELKKLEGQTVPAAQNDVIDTTQAAPQGFDELTVELPF